MKKIHKFNMVEIALAIAIIAVGISAILVLFPIGINATRAAMDENSSSDVAEYIANFVKGKHLARWKAEFDTWNNGGKTGTLKFDPNYTKIALMGLLGKYKPTKAWVTVDGVTSEYENVWMVSTMNGRYLGGGMKLTPEQDRLNPTNEVSVVVLTSKSRLRILTVFPKVFKGNHTKYTKVFKVIRGHEVSVEYERSVALQLDGETIPDLKKYSAKSASEKKEEATV